MRTGTRLACLAVLGIALAAGAAGPVAARDWHHRSHAHTRLFLGFNFGAPAYYYPPPRYYYYPPPVYYVPPPRVYYVPAPAPVCRVFRGDATVDASGRPFYGTACLEADGRWHIVN